MVVRLDRLSDNLTITLVNKEGDSLLEAIDAIVDPGDNEARPEMMEILRHPWLKLHSARSH